jgi:hypothetical protein
LVTPDKQVRFTGSMFWNAYKRCVNFAAAPEVCRLRTKYCLP